jgi:HSP20 family molecular chaperone IbpA
MRINQVREIAPSVDMFRDGVLEIRVPRTEEAGQKTKKVTIE